MLDDSDLRYSPLNPVILTTFNVEDILPFKDASICPETPQKMRNRNRRDTQSHSEF
jgi:hypothetical protein